MEELQIRLLEGQGARGVTYAFRYPSTGPGDTPFDRWWLQRARQLRQWAVRTPAGYPTAYFSEWQESRRDGRFCSGFLEVSRRVGHSDWSLWRISATFGPVGGRPLPLSGLLGANWKTALQPLVLQRLQAAAQGETPFFRGWQRRACAFLDGGRYYLTDQGLCVWFPQEALAPKNAGLPSVLLPYDCAEILRPFAPND
ncbi:MAG: hypothetical protein IKU58_07845 [Clostridia bacterium]|nr:hypothetical protein [Clostridia bacterium]